RLATFFFSSLYVVLQVISKGGAERRILGGIKSRALKRFAGQAEFSRLNVKNRVFHRKQVALMFKMFPLQSAQRSVVIQNIETTAKGGRNKIISLLLNREVRDSNCRHPPLEENPFSPAIECKEQAELSAHEQQIRIGGVLGQSQHWTVRG